MLFYSHPPNLKNEDLPLYNPVLGNSFRFETPELLASH